MSNREYLGDSCYGEYLPDGSIRLYLDNGMGEHNEIIMEPQVLDALNRFRERMKNTATVEDKG